MFNKKKIEELQASIKSLSNKISELESKSEQVSELQTQFDNILAKLDSENFSKDWDEYLKWKEMKDDLPDLEEMYNLKTLKRLLAEYDEEKKAERLFLIQAATAGIGITTESSYNTKTNATSMALLYKNRMQATENKIHQYLEKIGKQKNKKELIGILKLYGISTDWIKP
jgi:hypothetical protein